MQLLKSVGTCNGLQCTWYSENFPPTMFVNGHKRAWLERHYGPIKLERRLNVVTGLAKIPLPLIAELLLCLLGGVPILYKLI